VVEGEACPVGGAGGVRDGPQVAGGDAGFEDEIGVRLGDAGAVVYDREHAVAAGLQGRGDVDAGSAGVAGVTKELEEGVLDVAQARGVAAGALRAGEAGEARAEVAVGAFHAPSGRPRSRGSRG
jgi:hypothetical protein